MSMCVRLTGCALALLIFSGVASAADGKSEFARTTIDVGVVVSDLAKSVKFYTEAIGFTEAPGFSVPADFCKEAGLTDRKPLAIRVLVLGEGDSATKLKLMELPGVPSKKSDNAYIHSQLGYRYLTIFVTDASAAMARLKKAGATSVTKAPLALPEGLPQDVTLSVVRDPDGNLIELIGPKR